MPPAFSRAMSYAPGWYPESDSPDPWTIKYWYGTLAPIINSPTLNCVFCIVFWFILNFRPRYFKIFFRKRNNFVTSPVKFNCFDHLCLFLSLFFLFWSML